MSDAQTQRELGALSTKVEHLGDAMTEIRNDVKAIRSVIDESKGGVKVMLAAASVGGAFTALIAELGIKAIFK